MNVSRLLLFCLLLLVRASSIDPSNSTDFHCASFFPSDRTIGPCFLEKQTSISNRLKTSGTTFVLPCHVARLRDSLVEWWFVNRDKQYHLRIHPVFPAVRPIALRFLTSLSSEGKQLNETDVVDASILLRHINVDDSGLYVCLVRSLNTESYVEIDELLQTNKYPMLRYQLEVNSARLCQMSPAALPCFSSMRTSSPTIVDAFQTTFLQCLVNSFNRPISVFWVVGNVSSNSVLITDYLTVNQHKGDKLRRIFPMSSFDFSIELSVNRSIVERTYSCVIDGPTNSETTLFSYIVRSIEIETDDPVEEKSDVSIVDDEKLEPNSTVDAGEETTSFQFDSSTVFDETTERSQR